MASPFPVRGGIRRGNFCVAGSSSLGTSNLFLLVDLM
jgi:hypothetical protein